MPSNHAPQPQIQELEKPSNSGHNSALPNAAKRLRHDHPSPFGKKTLRHDGRMPQPPLSPITPNIAKKPERKGSHHE